MPCAASCAAGQPYWPLCELSPWQIATTARGVPCAAPARMWICRPSSRGELVFGHPSRSLMRARGAAPVWADRGSCRERCAAALVWSIMIGRMVSTDSTSSLSSRAAMRRARHGGGAETVAANVRHHAVVGGDDALAGRVDDRGHLLERHGAVPVVAAGPAGRGQPAVQRRPARQARVDAVADVAVAVGCDEVVVDQRPPSCCCRHPSRPASPAPSAPRSRARDRRVPRPNACRR